jgi:hypothetical protein
LREDAALEAQLRELCYGMAFVTKAHGDYQPRRKARFPHGQLRRPKGGLPPMLLAPRPGDVRDSGVTSRWGATSVSAGCGDGRVNFTIYSMHHGVSLLAIVRVCFQPDKMYR